MFLYPLNSPVTPSQDQTAICLICSSAQVGRPSSLCRLAGGLKKHLSQCSNNTVFRSIWLLQGLLDDVTLGYGGRRCNLLPFNILLPNNRREITDLQISSDEAEQIPFEFQCHWNWFKEEAGITIPLRAQRMMMVEGKSPLEQVVD